jgi:hypothetical protein
MLVYDANCFDSMLRCSRLRFKDQVVLNLLEASIKLSFFCYGWFARTTSSAKGICEAAVGASLESSRPFASPPAIVIVHLL